MKRSIALAILATLSCALASQAQISDGLISYWSLDGNFNDFNGLNDGGFNGISPANFQPGKFGTGIDLDGINQFIDVGNDSSLNRSQDNVSLSGWFRVDNFDTDWQAIIAKGENLNFRVSRRSGTNSISYSGGAPEGPDNGPNVNDGQLHHFAAVTRAGVQTELWIDGNLVSVALGPEISDTGSHLLIGANPDTVPMRYWDGLIDDVGIWDRPLEPLEIARIWDAGAGATVGSILDFEVVPGDVDRDGDADTEDFEVIRINFLKSASGPTEGDLNLDGVVDFNDFRIWRDGATSSNSAGPSDLDGDNNIDGIDLLFIQRSESALTSNWKRTFGYNFAPPVFAQAVPEPGSLAIASLSTVIAITSRYRFLEGRRD